MTQTWDATLVLPDFIASGYGNTISSGYGGVVFGQSWDVTLFDNAANGYGNTVSSGYGTAAGVGEATWYDLDVTVLEEGATRPFLAPLDIAGALAPLDVAPVLAELDVAAVFAPLDVAYVLAPLDMETEA